MREEQKPINFEEAPEGADLYDPLSDVLRKLEESHPDVFALGENLIEGKDVFISEETIGVPVRNEDNETDKSE